jgi:hypothetical protein
MKAGFRELELSEAQFPRRSLLGDSVNRGETFLREGLCLIKGRFLYTSIGLAHKFTSVSKKW